MSLFDSDLIQREPECERFYIRVALPPFLKMKLFANNHLALSTEHNYPTPMGENTIEIVLDSLEDRIVLDRILGGIQRELFKNINEGK